MDLDALRRGFLLRVDGIGLLRMGLGGCYLGLWLVMSSVSRQDRSNSLWLERIYVVEEVVWGIDNSLLEGIESQIDQYSRC